ncbi:MAG: glycoside hydrolase family 88 protein [Vicinamibacterales bacterium]
MAVLWRGDAIHAQPAPGALANTLSQLAAELDGYGADAAGMTAGGQRLLSLEPTTSAASERRRLVIIGGLDGSGAIAEALVGYLRRSLASGPLAPWSVSVIPCARPESCETPGVAPSPPPAFPPADGFYNADENLEFRYVWRWTAMQAPDLVIDVRAGAAGGRANVQASAFTSGLGAAAPDSLAGALATGAPSGLAPVPAVELTTAPEDLGRAIDALLTSAASLPRSPLHEAVAARLSRSPLDVARLLAPKYPAQPSMSYIPGLAWSGALHLSEVTGEPRWREKPRADMQPWLSGEKDALAEPHLLTSFAGLLAFSDLGALQDNAVAAELALDGAKFILPREDGEIVRFPRHWTDDMFMASSILARAAARGDDPRYAQVVQQLLTTYADDLQRSDGLFNHAADAPHAWGRGNGFAAFGLMEALTWLPEDWPARERIHAIYRRHMAAMALRQAADGSWRQVVDEPGSYREETVTAMTLTAMARGVRMGWLDADVYRPVVDRAWDALKARVAPDGTLVDVCTGTGAGPTKDYYLDRAAIFGADDRGGAMALTAAMEMAALMP